jgi:hypothetical protein
MAEIHLVGTLQGARVFSSDAVGGSGLACRWSLVCPHASWNLIEGISTAQTHVDLPKVHTIKLHSALSVFWKSLLDCHIS